MTQLYNQSILKVRRKSLRRALTGEERIIWSILKKYINNARFRRQYSIGAYILDFYSPRYRVGIELDGAHHLNQVIYDKERDIYLQNKKILILRFLNEDIRNNLPSVTQKIKMELLCREPNRSLGSPL
ncbi:MAG: DUF559 domain-containing protein [bacterium]